MKHRERLIESLNHKEPDRVPIDVGGITTGITEIAHRNLRQCLGIKGKEEIIDKIQQLVKPNEEILKKFGIDTRYIYLPAPEAIRGEDFPGDIWEDEWGVRRRKAAYYYDMIDHPLKEATVNDLKKIKWPDPHLPARFEGLEEETKRLYQETDYALIVNVTGSIFEFSWYLRGYENFMMDLIINPSFASALMDRMLEFQIGLFEEILNRVGKYVQVVQCGDDITTQNGPAISIEVYRKLVKSRQKKLFQFIKSKTDAKLFYHSCGSVYSFIPDLIEIGIDILNPIQVSAKDMETKRLKREFGKDISFWGGIDTQHILPFGSPAQVREEVKKRIDELAPGGGYILNSVHNLQADVPPENIVAMFETAIDYGKY
ncbi:MAG: uroporphyrinogen decarboxylase family protein [Candidatus Aerophobetes bacterium]|nr:uroporphyrinogen decarboxylase family protein [Candidatus Aerophobetes bacterium]